MQTPNETRKTEVPATLVAAVAHLRETFDEIHFQFGWTTRQLCFARLHGGAPRTGVRNLQDYAAALPHLKARVGNLAARRFEETLARGTASATFKAFYDLYDAGLQVQISLTFEALLRIGQANRLALAHEPIAWAQGLSDEFVDENGHKIPIWIKDVCDEQPFDPQDDTEESIFWRRWRAPSLLIMEPSRFAPFSPQRVWERNDIETSQRWLDAFRDDSLMMLKHAVKTLAGTAALAEAMQQGAPKEDRDFQLTQNFHLNGPNTRVNIASQDSSQNFVRPAAPSSHEKGDS